MTGNFPVPPAGKVGWPWTDVALGDLSSRLDEHLWPRISVVTPSYNQGWVIEETIRSVLLQGYPNLEYVIIDGGSTDDSVDIIRKYDPWLAYWVSEPDRGQSDAINKGWKLCTGEIVAWLNADDLYEPGALFKIANAWHADPRAGLWHGLCYEFDESGIRRIMGGPYDMKLAIVKGYDEGGRVAQPAAFISRAALNRVGMVDRRFKQSMDKELYQRLAAFYPAVHIPRILARFRVHSEQLSQQHQRDPEFFIQKERLMALENLFLLGDLPRSVSSQRRKALARTHLDYARELRFGGQPMRGFKHLLLSLSHQITPILNAEGMRTLCHTILGPKVSTWLSAIKRRCLQFS